MNDLTKSVRFAGTRRLFGEDGLVRLGNARVAIIGIGGVGSWAVETLARTGIGNLTLIDGDVVVESNINRQIQATDSTLGKPKVLALAERIALINPDCFVEPLQDFVRPDNLDALVGNRNFDFVIDAIDSVRDKTALIAYCKEKAIPLVTVGSAGGQMDPTRIDICDLSRTQQEPLLAKVRKRLRSQYGFTRNPKNKFGIDAVYSLEPVKYPGNAEAGSKEEVPGLNPAGFGTTMAVTAGFGLAAASYVLRRIALPE
ncbi:tRNA threonylcarbamoyladenosine dehydratase [uncultured Oxalobacter sp.]|uniref:tRNA threonylcarbamoyladenosine dehydratase n=1 Tax=uncultured Oxalobacter sp. TaxID=337245 RepID=UPI00259346F4|nr:tRNA threonylcarbamoyladenosine dehydratase [uncultured Oxalobacter sp.]